MIEALFLIPGWDNDGTCLDGPVAILEADLFNLFGGFSKIRGGIVGWWMNDQREKFRDQTEAYVVHLEEGNLQALKDLLSDFKCRTKQQAIWLRTVPVDVFSI
jgi:hypothetical protein